MADDNGKLSLDIAGEVDLKLEEEGAWFEHTPDDVIDPEPHQIDGFKHLLVDANGTGLHRVKVCSTFVSSYQNALRDANQRLLRFRGAKRRELEEKARMELIGKHCLLDWELTDREGNAVPLTKELSQLIMTEPKYRNHRNFIVVCVASVQEEQGDTIQDDAGN